MGSKSITRVSIVVLCPSCSQQHALYAKLFFYLYY